MTLEAIIFYILLIDAISANIVAISGSGWYAKYLRTFSRWFPMAKGWAIYYLILVLWVGTLLYRMGTLGF